MQQKIERPIPLPLVVTAWHIKPHEPIENSFTQLIRNTRTFIFRSEVRHAALKQRLRRGVFTRRRNLECIDQEIQQNLPHSLLIECDTPVTIMRVCNHACAMFRQHASIMCKIL